MYTPKLATSRLKGQAWSQKLRSQTSKPIARAFRSASPPSSSAKSSSASARTSARRRTSSAWKPLATLIAREAKLYLPATKSSDGSWRAECGRLFGARGTFVTTFASQPTPEPERTPFGIAVGCRFRPPGGTTSAEAPAEQRDVVLPLHQRLRLIAAAHHCSLTEARKRLWAPQAECALDPWATAAAAESKENLSANLSADEEASAAEDDEKHDEKREASGAATSTESAAGLIALQGGRAIVCAPGAGIRAFEFDHTFADESSQLEVWATPAWSMLP